MDNFTAFHINRSVSYSFASATPFFPAAFQFNWFPLDLERDNEIAFKLSERVCKFLHSDYISPLSTQIHTHTKALHPSRTNTIRFFSICSLYCTWNSLFEQKNEMKKMQSLKIFIFVPISFGNYLQFLQILLFSPIDSWDNCWCP